MNSPMRILHLEDNRSDAELIKEALGAEGFTVEVARVDSRAEFDAALELAEKPLNN